MPFLCIRLLVILHQHSEKDDDDDLQDEAGERQLQSHVGCRVCHVFFPARRGGEGQCGSYLKGQQGLKHPTHRLSHIHAGSVLSAETRG